MQALLAATADANVPADQARHFAARLLDDLPTPATGPARLADRHAADLLDSHRRVRAGAGAARRGLKVTAQKPVDVLGVYTLPAPARVVVTA